MTQTLRALETSYGGCRFRSRLEARWAVFMDKVGIKWEYESEGFDLGSGLYYLPDFWLPEPRLQHWIEIKPLSAKSVDLTKSARLAEKSGGWVVVIAGQPWLNSYRITGFRAHPLGVFTALDWCWIQCCRCEEVRIDSANSECARCKGRVAPQRTDTNQLVTAFEAARSERFGT